MLLSEASLLKHEAAVQFLFISVVVQKACRTPPMCWRTMLPDDEFCNLYSGIFSSTASLSICPVSVNLNNVLPKTMGYGLPFPSWKIMRSDDLYRGWVTLIFFLMSFSGLPVIIKPSSLAKRPWIRVLVTEILTPRTRIQSCTRLFCITCQFM